MGERKPDLENRRFKAELLREFSIFFAVLFLTCVVGIIELLPELEKMTGAFSWLSLSALYFGLTAGSVYCVDKCFWLYEQQRGAFGFNFPEIEPFYSRGKMIRRALIIGILVVFIFLYFVKVGILR
jgi:hypothetical protein